MSCEDNTLDSMELDQEQEQDWLGSYTVASDLCRICAEESSDVIQIFGDRGADLKLVDKIHIHLPIMVTKNDLLPLNVCMSCVSKLELCHETVVSCIEADTKLKLMFGIDSSQECAEPEMSEAECADGDTISGYSFNILNPEDKAAYKSAVMKLNNSTKNGMMQKTTNLLNANEDPYQVESEYMMQEQEEEEDDEEGEEVVEQYEENYDDEEQEEEEENEEEAEDDQPYLMEDYTDTELVEVADYTASWEELEYICYYCEAGIMGKTNFVLHQTSVHQNEVFSCPMCELVFELETEFKDHLDSHEEKEAEEKDRYGEQSFKINKRYQCSSCNKVFDTKLKCLQHPCFVNNPAESMECPKCNRKFTLRSTLVAHMKRHKGIFTCRVCLKVFTNRGAQLLHRRGHSREELLGLNRHSAEEVKFEGNTIAVKCPICGEIFPTKEKMELHFPVHTESSYPCHICGKILSKRNTLEYHLRTHTGEKPFACRHCPSAFQSRIGLIVHERKHTGEKPFKCNECDMAFRCRATLNQHKVIHSEDRPFTCSHCGRGFRRRDTLETHVRTHTDERPYACSICGRAFRQKGDCNKHERTHEKKVTAMLSLEEPCITFSCSICGLEVTEQDDLDEHLQNHHAAEGKSTLIMVNTREKSNEKSKFTKEEQSISV